MDWAHTFKTPLYIARQCLMFGFPWNFFASNNKYMNEVCLHSHSNRSHMMSHIRWTPCCTWLLLLSLSSNTDCDQLWLIYDHPRKRVAMAWVLCRFKSYELFVLVSNRQDQIITINDEYEQNSLPHTSPKQSCWFRLVQTLFRICVRAYCAAKNRHLKKVLSSFVYTLIWSNGGEHGIYLYRNNVLTPLFSCSLL